MNSNAGWAGGDAVDRGQRVDVGLVSREVDCSYGEVDGDTAGFWHNDEACASVNVGGVECLDQVDAGFGVWYVHCEVEASCRSRHEALEHVVEGYEDLVGVTVLVGSEARALNCDLRPEGSTGGRYCEFWSGEDLDLTVAKRVVGQILVGS